MSRVFLSHSSKQKGYVEIVARKLGESRVVYDKWTFEAGNKTLDEIYKWLDNTGLFVFFISEESLRSPWVKKELLRAEEYIKNGKIKQFLPVIIDDSVNYSHPLIPNWMRDNYNIQYVSKPTKTSDLIKQKIRLINWDLFPKKNELDQLFVGRNEQLKEFETRIYDIDKTYPNFIIVSGLQTIGRRKFLRHALINSNTIQREYQSPSVLIDYRCSIEDLIIRIYGLGYSQKEPVFISHLLEKTLDEKVDILCALLREIHDNKHILLIEDHDVLIERNGFIPDWFVKVIDNLKDIPSLLVCVISMSKPRFIYSNQYNNLFCIEIPELEKSERIGLFTSLLKIEDISINRSDLKQVADIFSGFPEQIFYTIEYIKGESVVSLINNLHVIVEYNAEKVSRLIKQYEDNDRAMQLLKILSEYEFISFEMLSNILGLEEFEKTKSILTELTYSSVVEYLGSANENIRLNDAIRDYIQRANVKWNDIYRENLRRHVYQSVNSYAEDLERDVSDYVISIKEALKLGLDIPKEFIIPSHFINAMRELYNNERRFDEVIKLADRIFQNASNLDSRVLREIRYWLCLSLARKRDSRFLIEVNKLDGIDHNFLLGFYYRLSGRLDEALERLSLVLDEVPKHYRAKRELVQVYLNKEDYDEAYSLAEETFMTDKNNPYNIQSYFRCLLKTKGIEADDKLKELLEAMKNNINPKSAEMYGTSYAQYLFQIKKDRETAIRIADETILQFPKKIYPYLAKLEILNHTNNIPEIRSTIQVLEQSNEMLNEVKTKLQYLLAKAKIYKWENRTGELTNLTNLIRNNFSSTVYEKYLIDIDSI